MSIKQTNAIFMTSAKKILAVLTLALCGVAPALADEPAVGPAKGTLVVVGGGGKDAAIMKRFVALAGGPSALIVVVPTAGGSETYSNNWAGLGSLRAAGATNLVILHTQDRKEADTEKFAATLKKARAVWFGGGRQWRLVDSYLGTRTEKAFHAVLARGGVIGGSSAGATIQGSYLVRGAREGNTVMMALGYEQGFGFLRNTAVDQHWLARKRENDMVPVIEKHPELLGISLDEDTAIVVHGDRCEVIGASKVGIYDSHRKPAADEKPYLLLNVGDRFNLKTRKLEP